MTAVLELTDEQKALRKLELVQADSRRDEVSGACHNHWLLLVYRRTLSKLCCPGPNDKIFIFSEQAAMKNPKYASLEALDATPRSERARKLWGHISDWIFRGGAKDALKASPRANALLLLVMDAVSHCGRHIPLAVLRIHCFKVW